MLESWKSSRTEMTIGAGQLYHTSAKEVVINAGSGAEVHIVDPKSVVLNGGVGNLYIIYTDDNTGVSLKQDGGIANKVEFKPLADYQENVAKSSSSSDNSSRSVAVGAGQVYIGGAASANVVRTERESTSEESHDQDGDFTRLTEWKHKLGAKLSGYSTIEGVGGTFQQLIIDEAEGERLGITPGEYFLSDNLSTAPTRVGENIYRLVTSTTVKSSTAIGLGHNRTGYAVQKNGKYLYQKS